MKLRPAVLGLALAITAGCIDQDPTGNTDRSSLAISDAAKGGLPGFYFLPPMLADPGELAGTFDPTRHPTVRIICATATGPSCPDLAAFEFGTGPETVSLDLEGESYHALWHTPPDLALGAGTYRLIVEEEGVELAHGDLWVVGSRRETRGISADFLPLVRDNPFPIRFRIEARAVAPPEGVAGSAEIGLDGGHVEGLLAGGGSVRLDVPGGALDGAHTFTFTPKTPSPGELHAFGLGPAGVQLHQKVTLTIILPESEPVTPDTWLSYRLAGNRVFVPVARDPAAHSLVAQLSQLVAPTSVTTALRAIFLPAILNQDEEDLIVVNADGATILAGAQAVLDSFTISGTSATVVQINALTDAMSTAASVQNTAELATPRQTVLEHWRDKVCSYATQVVERYAGLSVAAFEIADYRRETELILRWKSATLPFSDPFLNLPFAGCPPGTPPDLVSAIGAFTDRFIDRLKSIADNTDIVARFDEILDLRIPPLLDLERDLALYEVGDRQPGVRSVGVLYFNKLRPEAYSQCRTHQEYRFIARLVALEEAGTIGQLSAYSLAELAEDVHQCGTDMTWTVKQDASQVATGRVGGGASPGTATLTANVNLEGQHSLEIGGTVHPIFCVGGASGDAGVENQEQLAFRLRTSSGSFTLATLPAPSPIGSRNYFATEPYTVTTADLRTKAGLDPAIENKAELDVVRVGNSCGHPFYAQTLGEETVLSTLKLTIAADQCSAALAASKHGGASLRIASAAASCGTLSIVPTSTTLNPGGTRQFLVTMSGLINTGVTWSASGGAIGTTGFFVAPNAPGNFTVTARSVEDPTLFATATVHVVASGGVLIGPTAVAVGFGRTAQFSTLLGTAPFTWATDPGAGTISSTGLFRAGTTAGQFSVLATSVAGGTGVATVLVDPWIGLYRGSYREFFPTPRLGIATIQITRFLSPRVECPLAGIACYGIAPFDAGVTVGQCFFQPPSNGAATVHGKCADLADFGGGELQGTIENGTFNWTLQRKVSGIVVESWVFAMGLLIP